MAKEKIVNIENEPVCVSEECRAISMFMHPKNIAIVGASNTPGKPGNATMVNLLAAGFEGGIYPVHPRSSSILSVPAFKSVYALPVVPDLGIIVVPAPAVPGVVEEFGKKGTRAVVVISADMNQKADDGRTLSQIMMSHAKKYKIRIVGPNCIGVQSPYSKVNGSFMCSMAAAGHIGLISQSGALAASGVDWAKANGIGFSHIFSIGDQADVDISDLVEFLTVQEECAAIVIYMESIKDPERFVHASQRAAIRKPVFCLKAGRSASAQKAAASHTGALATGDEFYETLFRRAGVQRVDNFQEVFSRASIAGYHLAAKSRKLTILTNGGGSGILAVDRLASLGGELAELHADTIEKLSKVLPAGWSHLNPVDIVGDAPGNRYADALNILKHAPEVDTVFTIFGPTSITSSLDVAERLVEVVKRHNFKNLYFGWTGGDFVAAGREFLHGSNLPVCSAPEDGVEAFMGLIRSHEISDRIKGGILPLSRSKEKKEKGYAAAKKIIDVAAKAGRSTLTEAEAKAVFGLYGVPTVETFVAKTPKEAGRYALENIRGKVAIKIASEEISHKSDVGGVMLSLAPEEVEAAAGAMISGVRAKVGPKVKIQGVSVQEMIDKSEMFELLVGTTRNPVFGPAMVFGTGGKAVEVEKDSAMEFIPLDDKLAMEMVQRTRIYNKLKGFRDVKPVDFKMLSKIIVAVSDMMLDFPEIKELDINPVLADSKRIIAVDARIILDLESKDNKKGSKK